MKQDGFITVLLVIILGAISLSLSIWIGTSTVWTADTTANNRASAQARAVTSACAETALDELRQNNSLSGNFDLVIEDNQCSYSVVNTGGNNRTINVVGIVGPVTRKLELKTTAFSPSLSVESWKEVP
jgi:hypothetical protein